MSPAQQKLYFREWQAARKALRALGRSPKEADAERHAIHERVLGVDKSSSDFTNREFDLVRGAFRAISQPESLAPQLEEADQPAKRCRFVIQSLCRQLGESPGYAEAIAYQMARERKLPGWDLDVLKPAHLKKIIIALRKQVDREKDRSQIAAPSEPTPAPADADGDPF